MISYDELRNKCKWVRQETIRLHGNSPETRLASSLSDVEIFVALYYGQIICYNSSKRFCDQRDRVVISKGHGAISLYPILADLDFFDSSELKNMGKENTFLGVIPDTMIPGFETINGSLGHGLGVACGMAYALKAKKKDNDVYVICGDGELNEGAVWEGVMFASYHKLDNIILIIDNNKMSMLGYQKDILGLDPLNRHFESFDWDTYNVDGHDIEQVHQTLLEVKEMDNSRPKVIIADTVKGKGVPQLETDELSHVKSLSNTEIEKLLKYNG